MKFCTVHKLDAQFVDGITDIIEHNLEEYIDAHPG